MGAEKLALSITLVAVALVLSAPFLVQRFVGAPISTPVAVQRVLIPTPTPVPFRRPKPTQPPTITLQGLGNNRIQIFSSLTIDADVVATFAAGTQCIKLDGPISVLVEGIDMSFYRLNCNDHPGYVNAKWVR